MDDDIATLVSVAGVDEDVARNLLQLTNGDVNQAISLYYDNPDVVQNMGNAPPAASAPSLPPIQRVSGPRRPNTTGREDESGVIHIDSDDDGDDIDMLSDDYDENDQSFTATHAAAVARSAQEEEDAAMAKRLQEELYGSGPAAGGDGVRAPIQRTTETLVAPSYGDHSDHDMEAAVMEQLRRRQHQHRPRTQNNPFSQTVWDAAPGQAGPASGPAIGPAIGPPAQSSRQARLAELYRPPVDLISDLTWDQAREDGREEKKWILVNIQDLADFNCQVLNRDIWKNDNIRQLVQESFLFLQYTKEDVDAQQYINYYLANGLHENPDNYPHVAIVDPRTGEQVKVWSGRPFPEVMDFYEQLVEFLDRYSLAANSKNPVAKTKPREKVKDVDRMTEEEMLEMAMQASLQTTNGASAGPSVQDPDLLTSSVSGLAGAAPAAEAEAPAAEESAFVKISAEKPHTEPAHDPASTTRIQFRHAGGRVIRRFATSDPVERVYEWLKAEPLEGKDGMEFELKLMPQGRDLAGDLDKTVEEAGLKQATVMIEYIEP